MIQIEHTVENDFTNWTVLPCDFDGILSNNVLDTIISCSDWITALPSDGRFSFNLAAAAWWFEHEEDAFIFYMKYSDILLSPR